MDRLSDTLARALPAEARPAALQVARRVALALASELAGACERLELAGSIRREKSTVSDIEIVAIPQLGPSLAAQPALFEGGDTVAPQPRVNRLWEAIEAISEGHQRIVPIKPGSPSLEPDDRWQEKRQAGSRYLRLWLPKPALKVDLFLADAETWGAIFAIRTGSAKFSQALVTRWTSVSGGGHFHQGRLLQADGTALATPEEADVFRACRVELIAPAARRGAEDLRPLEVSAHA